MIGYIAGLALFLLSGCDSFLTQLSENNTTVANHFRSEADVEAAVYGMHTQFREVMGSFTQDYRDRGLLLDNFGLARWREANEHNLSGYTATAVEFSWMYEYKAVSAANLVIGNLYRAGLPEQRCSPPPRRGGRAETLLTSQTLQWFRSVIAEKLRGLNPDEVAKKLSEPFDLYDPVWDLT